ncbi:unnamed protein product [Arabidopsis lyrata]|nr:unnamed protein product [Arabidopsis lyrata]
MKHNGFLPMYKCATVRIDQTLPGSNMFMHEDMDQVPNSFDWKERSVVTDVKNQESECVMGLLGSQWMVGVFVGARVVLHYYGCCFWRWRIGGWLAAEVSWPPFSRFLLLLPRFLWISWLSFVDFGVVVALSSYSSLKR